MQSPLRSAAFGQHEREATPACELAAHGEVTAEQVSEPAADGKSESGAAVGRTYLHELVEDPLEVGRSDARSGVGDMYCEATQRVAFHCDNNAPTSRELHGVRHQVEHDLPNPLRIRAQVWQLGRLACER